ncbi:MAG: hydrogenase small subunit [Methanocellales archaeon]|nr:hydrogenase small subunit [Methanocellales archaeon]MDD4897970.1 hydrogenase small subunit [Methanocellales archaeon]MDD5446774.1 hydrogenase small subunit [Methanocellales archaeon]
MNFKSLDITKLDRRTFLKVAAAMGTAAFIGSYKADIVRALELSKTNIVWLEGADCCGCSESFLNAAYPDVIQAITKLGVHVGYHETLMMQQGVFVDGRLVGTSELNSELALEEYMNGTKPLDVLVIEGAIADGPEGSGMYTTVGGHPFKEMVERCAKQASYVVAIGMCATYGGIPAAKGSVTGSMGAQFLQTAKGGFLGANYVSKAGLPVVNIPCCPAHPDWLTLTLASIIIGKGGLIELDRYNRPTVFFSPDHTIHENCPRRGFYDLGQLDTEFAEGHCLWKLGCKAPITRADCATRLWNAGVNMCTQAGSPCIGCAEPVFPDGTSPFYVGMEMMSKLVGVDIDTIAKVAIGATAIGVGAHAVRRIAMKEDE